MARDLAGGKSFWPIIIVSILNRSVHLPGASAVACARQVTVVYFISSRTGLSKSGRACHTSGAPLRPTPFDIGAMRDFPKRSSYMYTVHCYLMSAGARMKQVLELIEEVPFSTLAQQWPLSGLV